MFNNIQQRLFYRLTFVSIQRFFYVLRNHELTCKCHLHSFTFLFHKELFTSKYLKKRGNKENNKNNNHPWAQWFNAECKSFVKQS